MKCWKIINSQDIFPEDEFTFSEVMEYAGLWENTFKAWVNENFKASDMLNMIKENGSIKTIVFITEKYRNMVKEFHNKFGIEEIDCFCTDIPTRNICRDEVDLEEKCANCDLKCYSCEKIRIKDKPFKALYQNYILSKFTKKD